MEQEFSSPLPAEQELFHSAQPPSEELGTNPGEVNHSRSHRALENKDRERLCWCFVCLCAATLLICVQPEQDSSLGDLPAQDSLSPQQILRESSAPGRFWLDMGPLWPSPCCCCPPDSSFPISLDGSGNHTWRANPQGLGGGKAAPNPGHPKSLLGPSFLEADVPMWCSKWGRNDNIILYLWIWRYLLTEILPNSFIQGPGLSFVFIFPEKAGQCQLLEEHWRTSKQMIHFEIQAWTWSKTRKEPQTIPRAGRNVNNHPIFLSNKRDTNCWQKQIHEQK